MLSESPHAQAYLRHLMEVVLPALLEHGVYDPESGHTPAPGRELAALEYREYLRTKLFGQGEPLEDAGDDA
jgi:hypothetical protein